MPDQTGMDKKAGQRWELIGVLFAAWLAFLSVPLSQGMGLSWDALNHHIYLGWIADGHRLRQDFLAPGYQGYQFPYLYWPVYKLAMSGASGPFAGAVLATLHLFAVPPLWMIARRCMPGREALDSAMRVMAVVLAFMSGVVLSLFDSSSNDLLAAIPLVWSVALGLEAVFGAQQSLGRSGQVIWSGLLAGVAVACKLSNGPLVALLPLVWLFSGTNRHERLLHTATACIATVVGFSMAYGYWGWQMWSHFGNPIYPFYDSAFQPLRSWMEWQP